MTCLSENMQTWNSNQSFDDHFKYFFIGYNKYLTEVMLQLDAEYLNTMLDQMQADIDKSKAEEAKTESTVESIE